MSDTPLADSEIAILIAAAIRNAMEDFHGKHLSDEQMAELNPIIRNAVFTTLTAMRLSIHGNQSAKQFMNFTHQTIPPYWEQPVLLQRF